MILSMTSFARCERDTEFGNLRWEMRSVNHRYLDVSLRMPDELRALEFRVRERIGERLKRGKVECGLRFQAFDMQSRNLAIDHEAVKRLATAIHEATIHIPNPAPLDMLEVLRWPGVMQQQEVDMEPLYEAVMALLDEALDDMVGNRAREGDKLKALILQRCDAIDALVVKMNAHLPLLREQLCRKLKERLAELKTELDPGRLEQEIVIQAQKMDVDEELDRLAAHVSEVRHVMGRDEPVGRRLDFLMQELNREANTLGSKSNDTDVTRTSVELKVLIEQIREQVQNIE